MEACRPMIFDYITGKCVPGSEKRSDELDYDAINSLVGLNIYPGTFNIQLDCDFPYKRLSLPISTDRYRLYICGVGTERSIRDNLPPVPGWVLEDESEPTPDFFVEVISIFNIRKQLKIENWPSTKVQLSLSLRNS